MAFVVVVVVVVLNHQWGSDGISSHWTKLNFTDWLKVRVEFVSLTSFVKKKKKPNQINN